MTKTVAGLPKDGKTLAYTRVQGFYQSLSLDKVFERAADGHVLAYTLLKHVIETNHTTLLSPSADHFLKTLLFTHFPCNLTSILSFYSLVFFYTAILGHFLISQTQVCTFSKGLLSYQTAHEYKSSLSPCKHGQGNPQKELPETYSGHIFMRTHNLWPKMLHKQTSIGC